MRAINAKMSRRLIEFILNGVGRNDLDVSVNHGGRVRAGHDAVPRVRLKEFREKIV